VAPSPIETEKKEADLRGRLSKSKVSRFSSTAHAVRRGIVSGLPKSAADAAKAPQPTTGSVQKPLTVSPGKVREHLAQEARVKGGTAGAKRDLNAKAGIRAEVKPPVQVADNTAALVATKLAAKKKGQQAAAAGERRDLYASLALLVLLLAGVMVWLRRSRVA